jgi:hypothetical protein
MSSAMNEDQILFSLMQWWLGISAGVFAALHFYAGKVTSWFTGFVFYASLGLCTHLLGVLTKTLVQ